MKINFLLVIILFVGLISCDKELTNNEPVSFEKKVFYYYQDEVINLKINSKSIFIVLKREKYSKDKVLNVLKKYPEVDLDNSFISQYNYNFIYFKENLKEERYLRILKEFNSEKDIYYATPICLGKNNELIWFTNEFFIKFSSKISEKAIKEFLKKNESNFSYKEQESVFDILCTVKNIRTGFESIELANKIHKLNYVDFSECGRGGGFYCN